MVFTKEGGNKERILSGRIRIGNCVWEDLDMLIKYLCRRNSRVIITLMLLFTLAFLLSGLAPAQAGPEDLFTLTLSVPDCQVISSNSTSISYKLEKPVDPAKVYFRWDFSNGMDRTLEKNLFHVTLFNVDDNVEVKLDRGQPSDFQNFNGTTIEAGDFKYTKLGRKPDPKIRRVEMTLKSNVLKPSTNYILTIGPKFEANNGNTLNKTYSWKFATSEAATIIGSGIQQNSGTTTNSSDDNINPDMSSGKGESATGGNGDGSGGGKGEPLELVSSTPGDGEKGVALDTEIRLSFSKNVINMMVKDGNLKCFSLLADNEPVEIEVVMADDQVEPEFKRDVVIAPVEGLQPDKNYTIKVASEFQSKGGVALGKELKINFSTGNGTEGSEAAVAGSNEKPADSSEPSADKEKNRLPVIILIVVIAAAGVSGYAYVRRKK